MIKQLGLFVIEEKLDSQLREITFELINRTTSLKYLLFLWEHLMPLAEVKSSSLFVLLKNELIPELTGLAEATGNKSSYYSKKSRKFWSDLRLYDPIYCLLEPRSPSRLVEIGVDLESRSKAILLRSRGIVGEDLIPDVDNLLEKIKFISKYAKEGHQLYLNERRRI